MIRFDTFVSSAVLLGAIFVTTVAYSALRQIESPGDGPLRSLPVGKQNYNITDQGRCIGNGNLSVEAASGVTILLNSKLKVKIGDRKPEVTTFVGAFFNALEQLVRANIFIEMEGRKIEITLSNPNPINIHIGVTAGDRSFARDFPIPGPIYLRPNGDGTFRIDAQASTSLIGQTPKPNLRVLGWSDITVSPAQGEGGACSLGDDALSLDELNNFVRDQLQNWRVWLLPMMESL